MRFLSFEVETVMAGWCNLRDPYRKKILKLGKGGGQGGGGAGGKKKLGSRGSSVAQQQEQWEFYEKMSFYKPYIYTNEYDNPCTDSLNLVITFIKIHFQ